MIRVLTGLAAGAATLAVLLALAGEGREESRTRVEPRIPYAMWWTQSLTGLAVLAVTEAGGVDVVHRDDSAEAPHERVKLYGDLPSGAFRVEARHNGEPGAVVVTQQPRGTGGRVALVQVDGSRMPEGPVRVDLWCVDEARVRSNWPADVVWVSVDGWRGDLVPGDSSAVARLADEAVEFSRAFAASGDPESAWRAMLEGRLVAPAAIGSPAEAAARPDTTLARILGERGYRSAFLAGRPAGGDPVAWGFERVAEDLGDAVSVIAAAERFLSDSGAGRVFMVLRLTDLLRIGTNQVPIGQEAARRDMIRSRVERVDAAIGRLLDLIEERGRTRETLVVLTAAHGQLMGEREAGWGAHRDRVDEGIIHVPLLVRWPEGGGGREDLLVSATDLAPTVLAALGLTVPGPMTGFDLAPVHSRSTERQRPIVALSPSGAVLRGTEWVYRSDRDGAGLWHLPGDPFQVMELSARRPEVSEYCARALANYLDPDWRLSSRSAR